jgi:hypothetical protein
VADFRSALTRFLNGQLTFSQIRDELSFRLFNLRRPVLVLFGGGSSDFHAAAQRLAKQARSSRKFGKIHAFTDLNIPHGRKFFRQHKEFITANPRGFGLWIWKPYVINWVQNRTLANRMIIYLDAGVYLNLVTTSARKRFDDYLRIAWRQKFLAFQLNPDQFASQGFPDLRETSWNRSDLLDTLGVKEEHRQTTQIEAGVFVIRNSQETRQLTKDWIRLMEDNDYKFLRDPDPNNQPQGFIEHRYDQAVLSALLKSRQYQTLAAENWFYPDWFSTGASYPFWSVRMRRG